MTANWLLADHITVEVGHGRRVIRCPLAEVLLVELTAAMAMEALSHVLRGRAYGTYRSAHECLTGILNWGVAIRWLPVGHVDVADIKRAPDPRVSARRRGARGNARVVPKDDIPDLDEVLLPFHRWVEDHHGHQSRMLLDLLAFSGPRIGEALALYVDRL